MNSVSRMLTTSAPIADLDDRKKDGTLANIPECQFLLILTLVLSINIYIKQIITAILNCKTIIEFDSRPSTHMLQYPSLNQKLA